MRLLADRLLLLVVILNCLALANYRLFRFHQNIGLYVDVLMLVGIGILRAKANGWRCLFVLGFFTYGLLTLLLTGGGVGSIINIISSVMVVFAVSDWSVTHRTMRILLCVFLGLNLLWVLNSDGYYATVLLNPREHINSNTVGVVLCYTAIYTSIFMVELNWRCSGILTFLLFIANGWAILNCRSRGSLIALIVFWVLDTIVPKSFWKNKNSAIVVISSIIMMGVVLPYVYVQLHNTEFGRSMRVMGKSLYTGRELIWSDFYSRMRESTLSWLFGLGSRVNLGSRASLNVHNNYLAVIANFGSIGFVLYYGFLIKQIMNVYKDEISTYQIRLILAFLCVLANGIMEVSTLWHVTFFLSLLPLGLANAGVYQSREVTLSMLSEDV